MSLQLRGVLAATLLLVLPAVGARADVVEDPLHGMVCSTGAAACNTDNGKYAPITPNASGDLTGFGWAYTGNPGGQTGDLQIFIMVPTELPSFTDPSITGTNLPTTGVTPTSIGTWTLASGTDLASFVGLGTASPANPFNAFQVGLDTSTDSFSVYKVDVGTVTLQLPSATLTDTFDMLGILPAGTDVVAFLTGTTIGNVATAPSGQLQVQPRDPTTPVPLPGTAFLFLGGLGALGWLTRRQRPHTPAPMQA